MVSMLKNKLYRFNRWFDKNETLKFLFVIAVTTIGLINIQLGNLLLGITVMLLLCAFTLYRLFVMDGDGHSFESKLFDRSKYDVPGVGEIVIVKKDFYYDGQFRKFINTSDQSQKPNWWKVPKGTELVILNVEETVGDWKIRFLEPTFNSKTKGDMSLYYLDTKDYWDTKANIRNKLLSKLGI
jgi:hypothetical protein